jgi:predicted phosphoribosyltransferase
MHEPPVWLRSEMPFLPGMPPEGIRDLRNRIAFMRTTMFQDRRDAGRVLARIVANANDLQDAIVLGLPRGGVPVAYEVAYQLNLPLDVFVVRKLGVPGEEELAMGAVASGGTVVLNPSIIHHLGISQDVVQAAIRREEIEIERCERVYREGHPPMRIEGRTAILIDDGLATGATMFAAARALHPRAERVIAAVPVAAESTCNELRRQVDEVICANTPQNFFAVGGFYRDFSQTTDEEVRSLLSRARSRPGLQVA